MERPPVGFEFLRRHTLHELLGEASVVANVEKREARAIRWQKQRLAGAEEAMGRSGKEGTILAANH